MDLDPKAVTRQIPQELHLLNMARLMGGTGIAP